jgi:hypothetical protein
VKLFDLAIVVIQANVLSISEMMERPACPFASFLDFQHVGDSTQVVGRISRLLTCWSAELNFHAELRAPESSEAEGAFHSVSLLKESYSASVVAASEAEDGTLAFRRREPLYVNFDVAQSRPPKRTRRSDAPYKEVWRESRAHAWRKD